MKRTVIISIAIGLLGSICIYAQIAAYYYRQEKNLVPTVLDSVIIKKSVSIWRDDFVKKVENLSQKESDIDKPMVEETVAELSDETLEQIKSEIDSFLCLPVVSDFLHMDSENLTFENKYDRSQLYEQDILYCDMEAWRYHGGQLDGFSNPEDYYNVSNIFALRYLLDSKLYDFVEEDHIDVASYGDSSFMKGVYIQYMGNYAISVYFQRNTDLPKEDEMKLLEISVVKAELDEGIAPESLYQYLEDDYYEVREAIRSENWVISPLRNKEVCVMNGALPKHPAQIFIRYREKMPDTIFRFTWEQGIADWIDEEHIVCYMIDWVPHLIHLETSRIEDIEGGIDDYDPCGAKYEINGNQLIAKVLGEEVYRWNIVEENHEVSIVKEK